MIKNKGNKGITLISLMFVVVIMLIITSIIIYSSINGVDTREINNMYNDIKTLNDKVDLYYSTYGKLPIIEEIYSVSNEEILQINQNDNEKYYVIDLEVLENLTLNYGIEYSDYKESKENSVTDIYIINEQSHNIYYVEGIELDGIRYYTLPGEYQKVEVPSANQIKVKQINKNIAILEISAANRGDIVKDITIYMNDNVIKTYTGLNEQVVTEVLEVALPFYENETFRMEVKNSANEITTATSETVRNENSIATKEDMQNLANAVNYGESFEGETIKLISDIKLERK